MRLKGGYRQGRSQGPFWAAKHEGELGAEPRARAAEEGVPGTGGRERSRWPSLLDPGRGARLSPYTALERVATRVPAVPGAGPTPSSQHG